MIASAFMFGAFSVLAVVATLTMLSGGPVTPTISVVWMLVFGAFFIVVGGIHLDRLYQAGISWNATGPETLPEGRWHDFLFSRIVFWVTLLNFILFFLAALELIQLSGALLTLAALAAPVTILWLASALRFDAAHVKQI